MVRYGEVFRLVKQPQSRARGLFRQARKPFAAVQLGQHAGERHVARAEQHHQVKDEIGRLANQFVRTARKRGNDGLHTLFAHFLGDLAQPLGMKARDIAGIGIGAAARGNGRFQAGEGRVGLVHGGAWNGTGHGSSPCPVPVPVVSAPRRQAGARSAAWAWAME
jgi:hypothetical protein